MSINGNYNELLDQCSQLIIFENNKELFGIINADPVFSLALIPFIALHCKSAQEFLGVGAKNQRTSRIIKTIRNKLKLTTDRYSKSKIVFDNILEKEDTHFKPGLVKQMLMGKDYYNMGIYLDREGHILNNTYTDYFFLDIKANSLCSRKRLSRRIGHYFGDMTARIHSYFTNGGIPIIIDKKLNIEIGYQDINAYDNAIFNNNLTVIQNIYVIHLLSLLGSERYLIESFFSDSTYWKYRQRLVAAIAVWNGLKNMYNKMNGSNDTPRDIIDGFGKLYTEGKYLFPSTLRNCVMHYRLIDKNNKPVIKPDCFNTDKILFGLIESCLPDMSDKEYFEKLSEYMDSVERFLDSLINIDSNKTLWDLNK